MEPAHLSLTHLSLINKLIDLLHEDAYAKTVVLGYEYYSLLQRHYAADGGLGFVTISKELRFMGRVLIVDRDNPFTLELY